MTTSARFAESVPGRLPRALWLEVLSYTSRSWFTPPPSEVDRLRLRLFKESEARVEAEKATREAAFARQLAERECERYRRLAQQLEQRLSSAVIGQHRSARSGGWLGQLFGGLGHRRDEEDVEVGTHEHEEGGEPMSSSEDQGTMNSEAVGRHQLLPESFFGLDGGAESTSGGQSMAEPQDEIVSA